jgi:ABC-2 type transport system ATP-binding protein
MTEAVATLDGVVKRYGPVTALGGASLAVHRGETVALLGPNGAGKSTAVGCLLGLLRPDDGRVEVFGGAPARAVAAGRVGAMLQQGALLDGLTVRELVGFVGRLYPDPLPVAEALERAGIADLAERRVERLSGGQAQRVRFAMAIAGNPELLFLDEPTVGMDVEGRRAFWAGVGELAAAGATVLFATHYLEEADVHADRVVVLMDGRVVAEGTASQVKAKVGTRRVRASVPAGSDEALRLLPGVVSLARHGQAVTIESSDADATVRALLASGVEVRDLEVTGVALEDAFVALTETANQR